MSFAWVPMALMIFFAGLIAQAFDTAQAVPGAGAAGQMQAVARVRAQQIAVFSSACSQAATASQGLVSPNIAVALPNGVAIAPGNSCMTTSAPGGGRYVYAWMPANGGTSAQVYAITQSDRAWWRVTATGIGTNMTDAQTLAFPASITAPAIVRFTQVNP